MCPGSSPVLRRAKRRSRRICPMFTGCFAGEGVAKARTMRSRMLRVLDALNAPRVLLIAGALLVFVPTAVSAVTVDQIIALSKAGVSEAVILALLDRDGNVLSIEPEQLVSLKREGLSDGLILAMLKNGRAEGEDAARADAALNASSILSSLAISETPTPSVVVVGHGPDLPNT